MRYKTIVTECLPKAKPMAAAVEEKSNEMAQQGYKLVTMAITTSAKAILVFEAAAVETAAEDEAKPIASTQEETA